jgi:protocatechuate 3,4-dioxygenase beta subunit
MATIARRRLLAASAGAVATIAFPTIVAARGLPRMTDGPFYPPPAYRAKSLDWDADLTTVRGFDPDGQPLPRARGEHLDLRGAVLDADGRPIDGVVVEIWQCDVFGSYRHPRGAGERVDVGFQGFGSTRSDTRGLYRFRTIRPVPYPGRTPHIHVKLRHPTFGEVTSQLFVAGEARNASDVLWQGLDADERKEVELRLQKPAAGEPVAWIAERDLIVPAR